MTKGLLETNRSFIKEEESGEPSVKGEGKDIGNVVPVTAFSTMVHSPPMIGPLVTSSEENSNGVRDGSVEGKLKKKGGIPIKKIKTGSLNQESQEALPTSHASQAQIVTEETKLRERSASKVMNMTMPKEFEMNMDIWQTNAVDETGSQKVASSNAVSEMDAGSVSKPRNVFKESALAQ